MTEQLWCAPGIFLAQVREDVVILDLKADQYHCLLDAAALMEVSRDGSLQVRDETTLAELISAGVVTALAQEERRPLPAIADREFEDAVIAPPLSAMLHAGAAMFLAALAFRNRSITQLIELDRKYDHFNEIRARQIVSAARAALPWVPFEGQCLQRTYQIRRLLWRQGVPADWIFGVRTWPFAAHCWLQIGDCVVADRLERIRRYTPIMAA